jgi:hypothetical protein
VCRHVTFDVPPESVSVPFSRELCRKTLVDWRLAQMVDDAQVIVSELVSNGVVHTRTPLGLSLSAAGGYLELSVSDGKRAAPVVRPHRADLVGDLDALGADGHLCEIADDRDPRLDVGAAGSVVGGRGMALVVSIASGWGVSKVGGGKSVWARMPIPPGWPPTVGCRCADGSIGLASGRTVLDAG